MRKSIQGIYRIRNIINDNYYIGSSNNITIRFYNHKWLLRKGCHHSTRLQAAWNKYGEKTFAFEVYLLVDDRNDLLKEEQKAISARRPAYNSAPSVTSQGIIPSEETRKKQSAFQKELWSRPGYREKMKATHRARCETPDGRAIMQKFWELGATKEAREKQEASQDKRLRVERLNASLKARWADPEFHARMTGVRRKQYTPEVREKMSTSQRRRYLPSPVDTEGTS